MAKEHNAIRLCYEGDSKCWLFICTCLSKKWTITSAVKLDDDAYSDHFWSYCLLHKSEKNPWPLLHFLNTVIAWKNDVSDSVLTNDRVSFAMDPASSKAEWQNWPSCLSQNIQIVLIAICHVTEACCPLDILLQLVLDLCILLGKKDQNFISP